MKELIFITLYTILVTSCNNSNNNEKALNDPFVTIVKLQSAQNIRDYDAAKKFIDLEKVYGQEAKDHNMSAEKVWKTKIDFNNSLAQDNKFTNSFPFHKYDISKEIEGNTATISFNSQSNVDVTYTLEKDRDAWKVTGIDYHK